jgi:hypothetical protein
MTADNARELGRQLAGRTTSHQGLAFYIEDPAVLRSVAQLLVPLIAPRNINAVNIERISATNTGADRDAVDDRCEDPAAPVD